MAENGHLEDKMLLPEEPVKVRVLERLDNGEWADDSVEYETLLDLADDEQTYIAFPSLKYIEKSLDLDSRLSERFRIPSIFWHELSTRSNGFFSSHESVEEPARLCHRSWFRFEAKRVADFHKVGQSHYEWIGLTFFTQYRNPGSMAILCFDVPPSFQGHLQDAIKRVPIPTSIEDVFGWHCELLDQVLDVFEKAVWSIRDVVRNFEKSRPTDFTKGVDFDLLHENARHVVHSTESLGVAVDVVEAMLKQHRSLKELSDAFSPGSLADPEKLGRMVRFRQVTDRLEGHALAFRAIRHRAQSNESRLRNEIALAFNTVSQRDSVSMIQLSETTMRDSQAMRRISFVTLLLLPATAVSTMFSSAFFNFQPPNPGSSTNVSPDFWIYWVITVPLTVFVYGIWLWSERRYRERMARELELTRSNTMLDRRLTRESTRRL